MPMSEYMRFSRKVYMSIREEDPKLNVMEIRKIIGQKWSDLRADEKKEYQDAWRADMTKYEAAIAAYRQSPEYVDWLKAVKGKYPNLSC